jgi:Ca-activated chloride channel family protein
LYLEAKPYVQLPMTTDYAAAKLFYYIDKYRNDSYARKPLLVSAIDLCQESFKAESKSKKKPIVVITDGENHEDNAIASAQTAYEKGIIVHTVGMGSEQGAPLPIFRNGRNVGFRKDAEGNTIMSKINENMLQEISAAGAWLVYSSQQF